MSQLSNIIGQTYKVIKQYIPREDAEKFCESFLEDSTTNNYKNLSTGFVDHCIDRRNYPLATAIATEKVSYLNELLGNKVLPSYTFTRIYSEGSSLLMHTDRESCEISLTIHLGSDEDWAFCLEDLDGNVVEVNLEPGDAILYDAPKANHWRKGAYTGKHYVQSFHHYVFLGGNFEEYQYDQPLHRPLSLSNFVRVYRNSVPVEVCKRIVEDISGKYSNDWKPAGVSSGLEGVRVCENMYIKPEYEIDGIVNGYVTEAIAKYNSEFSCFKPTKDYGYNCLRYYPGGKYEFHTDQHCDENREITMIIQLNDDYEGGQLVHANSVYLLGDDDSFHNLTAGDICIFPSNFMYPHAIKPVTSGVRYSIVTWVV